MRIIKDVLIERAVPMPVVRVHGKWAKILSTMKKGDSFVVDRKTQANGIHGCARQKGIKVSYRRLENGKFRVWRIN